MNIITLQPLQEIPKRQIRDLLKYVDNVEESSRKRRFSKDILFRPCVRHDGSRVLPSVGVLSSERIVFVGVKYHSDDIATKKDRIQNKFVTDLRPRALQRYTTEFQISSSFYFIDTCFMFHNKIIKKTYNLS